MVVEVVTLQPSHHDKDLIRFHLKQLAAGRMIKVDSFLRSAFRTQRCDKGKMCEELFHLTLRRRLRLRRGRLRRHLPAKSHLGLIRK